MNKVWESSTFHAFVEVNGLINNILTKLAENEAKLKLLSSLVEESRESADTGTTNFVDVGGRRAEGSARGVGVERLNEVSSELFNKNRTRPSSSSSDTETEKRNDHRTSFLFNRESFISGGGKDDSSDNDDHSSGDEDRPIKARCEQEQKTATEGCVNQTPRDNFDDVPSSIFSSNVALTQRYYAACTRGRANTVGKAVHGQRAACGDEYIPGTSNRVDNRPILRAGAGDNVNCASALRGLGARCRSVRDNFIVPNRFSLVPQAGCSSPFCSYKWFVFITLWGPLPSSQVTIDDVKRSAENFGITFESVTITNKNLRCGRRSLQSAMIGCRNADTQAVIHRALDGYYTGEWFNERMIAIRAHRPTGDEPLTVHEEDRYFRDYEHECQLLIRLGEMTKSSAPITLNNCMNRAVVIHVKPKITACEIVALLHAHGWMPPVHPTDIRLSWIHNANQCYAFVVLPSHRKQQEFVLRMRNIYFCRDRLRCVALRDSPINAHEFMTCWRERM